MKQERTRRSRTEAQTGPKVVYTGLVEDNPRLIKRMMLEALKRADPDGNRFRHLPEAIRSGVRRDTDHAGLLAEVEELLPRVEGMQFGLMRMVDGRPVLHIPVRIIMGTEGAGWQFRMLSTSERALDTNLYMRWSLENVAGNIRHILRANKADPDINQRQGI